MKKRYTKEQVSTALTDANGFVTIAAKNLRCQTCTVNEYIKRFPELKAVLDDARAATLDVAESQLMKLIEQGNVTAIIFFLKTQGRTRGYQEKIIQETTNIDFDFNLFSDDELRQISNNESMEKVIKQYHARQKTTT